MRLVIFLISIFNRRVINKPVSMERSLILVIDGVASGELPTIVILGWPLTDTLVHSKLLGQFKNRVLPIFGSLGRLLAESIKPAE